VKELDMIVLIGNIARKVAKKVGHIASDVGLSTTEALTLWKLRTGPCKTSEIADVLGLSPSTITGILDRLEAGGWISREADPGDRRAVNIGPTKKLTEFIKGAKRSISKGLERTFGDLSPDLIDRLCADLSRVLELLEAEDGAKR
jgi:DNA-binding MarR family transcriptional regulator